MKDRTNLHLNINTNLLELERLVDKKVPPQNVYPLITHLQHTISRLDTVEQSTYIQQLKRIVNKEGYTHLLHYIGK